MRYLGNALVRWLFYDSTGRVRRPRIDPVREAKAFALEEDIGREPLERMNICVRNPNLVEGARTCGGCASSPAL